MKLTNIITNIISLSLTDLTLLWVLMLLIIFISFKKNLNRVSKEEIKQSREIFQVYLDQYFITNRLLTFFLCFIYLCGISLIFILLRYLYLGQVTPLEASNSLLFYLSYCKVFITMALYKLLLDCLFHKELNKLVIYLTKFYSYNIFKKIMRYRMGEAIFGSLRVLCYRISTFTYKNEEYIPGNLPYYIHVNEYDYFLSTRRIQPLANKAQDLAEQYSIVQKCFAFLAYILRFIHIHISEVNKQLPYVVLGLVFLYELYNREFRYLYLASFIVLLIKTKHNVDSYINSRDGLDDLTLSKYFYKNEIDYKIQRMSFLQHKDITIDMNTAQNRAVFRLRLSMTFVDYCMGGFKGLRDPSLRQYDRRLAGAHRRYLITISFILITAYILFYSPYHIESDLFMNIPVIIILIPLIIMIYTGHRTYYPTTYEEDLNDADWRYSLKWNIIYWLMVGIQGYLVWGILFAPELILPDSEVIFDFIFRVSKIYTLEDKIMYLHKLFELTKEKTFVITINSSQDHYIYTLTLTDIDKEFLRFHLRQQELTTVISDLTTLKDIKEYIDNLYKNYYNLQAKITYWETLIQECANHDITLMEYFEAIERSKRQPIIDAWVTSILYNTFYLYLIYLRQKSSTDTTIQILTSLSIKDTIKYTWLIVRRLFGL
jgi:hypothetical protein